MKFEELEKLLRQLKNTCGSIADKIKSNQTLYKQLQDQATESIIKVKEKIVEYIRYLYENNVIIEIYKAKSLPQWQNLQEELKSRWLKIKQIIEKNQYNELRSEVG